MTPRRGGLASFLGLPHNSNRRYRGSEPPLSCSPLLTPVIPRINDLVRFASGRAQRVHVDVGELRLRNQAIVPVPV